MDIGINDDLNNFRICDFMTECLDLKGSDLLVFALIFTYNLTKKKKCKYTASYIANKINTTSRTVMQSLKTLTFWDYIIKEDIYEDKVKCCSYCVNFKEINRICKKFVE